MPLAFLNPVLLWGALAATIPLALHFWRRRMAREVRFSDLRFLREVQARQARTMGIKRYLLLLLRMLIIILLAAMIAGPRLSGLSSGGNRISLLMLIDGSASMQTREGEWNRFEKALVEARAMGGSLSTQSEVQILQVAADSQPLFADWLPARLLQGASLDMVQAEDTAFDLVGALSAAAKWTGRARYRAREVVLIGDFQSVSPDTAALGDAIRLLGEAGVDQILLRPVGAPTGNGGILDLKLPLRVLLSGERADVSATVKPGHASQEYHLELDGRPVAQAVATGGVGNIQTLVFPLVAPDPGLHVGRISTTADLMPADDIFPFVLKIPRRIEVLIVHGADQDRTGRGSWRYLSGALSPDGSGLFNIRDIPVADLHDNDLYEADLVFCVDPGRFGATRLEALLQWLRQGGRCVFLIGDPRMTDYLGATLLPAINGGRKADFRVQDKTGAQGLNLLPSGQALLAGFPERSLETLIGSRWRRYHDVDSGQMTVLIAFTGGEPALLETEIGSGRLLLLPFNLSGDATDFAGNPMSVPFWRRVSVYVLGDKDRNVSSIRAGEPLRLRVTPAPAADALDGAYTLRFQSSRQSGPAGASRAGDSRIGDSATRPVQLQWQRMTPVLDGGMARYSGLYAFLSDRDTLGLRAVSVPISETLDDAGDTAPITALLKDAGLSGIADLAAIDPAGLGDLMAGRDLRILLALLVAVLLLLETWISRKA